MERLKTQFLKYKTVDLMYFYFSFLLINPVVRVLCRTHIRQDSLNSYVMTNQKCVDSQAQRINICVNVLCYIELFGVLGCTECAIILNNCCTKCFTAYIRVKYLFNRLCYKQQKASLRIFIYIACQFVEICFLFIYKFSRPS
jgi:hypothetical protein